MPQTRRVLIVEARFYEDIADHLATGAIAALEAAGYAVERVSVPGALEIPGAIAMADRGGERDPDGAYDGYVALGCVIRGETGHYDIVCNESARGLQDLAVQRQVAVGNGILTVENGDQARVRADPAQKNKGGEAAVACLRMIDLKQRFGLFG
ncbi:MAG: 6,7-dimethyl-8-ribityllumazine synthase [Alphaproteobacteria bacterium]|jgi:6,7-dimethyl-8-ribityllumazine synthase|nr:6,7-dimethyl-8-ribityllumazine synthase [Alphaproteobacteria bacterium]